MYCSVCRVGFPWRLQNPGTKRGSLARVGRRLGPKRESQSNRLRIGSAFPALGEAPTPRCSLSLGREACSVCAEGAHVLSVPIQQPRTSDSPPGDLEAWRVLLPSRQVEERVARLVRHENASRDSASDLALLQLRTRVNLTAAPSAVCLPHPEHFFLPGSRCRLARWGRGGARGRAGTPPGWGAEGRRAGWGPRGRSTRLPPRLAESAAGSGAQLEAQLLNSWWCHCLYGRQGESVPPPGDPPHWLCPAYQEEEEAGRCWVSDRSSPRPSGPGRNSAGGGRS